MTTLDAGGLVPPVPSQDPQPQQLPEQGLPGGSSNPPQDFPKDHYETEQWLRGVQERVTAVALQRNQEYTAQLEAAEASGALEAQQKQQQKQQEIQAAPQLIGAIMSEIGFEGYEDHDQRAMIGDAIADLERMGGDPAKVQQLRVAHEQLSQTSEIMREDRFELERVLWSKMKGAGLGERGNIPQRASSMIKTFLSSAAGGFVGERGNRFERVKGMLIDSVDEIVDRRFGEEPGGQKQSFGSAPSRSLDDMLRNPTPSQMGERRQGPPAPAGLDRDQYRQHLLGELFKTSQMDDGEGGSIDVETGIASGLSEMGDDFDKFGEETAHLSGMLIPLGKAAQVGQFTMKGGGALLRRASIEVAKRSGSSVGRKAMTTMSHVFRPARSKVGKIAAHQVGSMVGLSVFGYVQPIDKTQEALIGTLPEEDREGAERGLRFQNAFSLGLIAPFYALGGVAGSVTGKLSGKATKLFGQRFQQYSEAVGGGAGMAVSFGVVGDLGQVAWDKFRESGAVEALGLDSISKAEELGFISGAANSSAWEFARAVASGDPDKMAEAAEEYAGHAAPGFAAFGGHNLLRMWMGRASMSKGSKAFLSLEVMGRLKGRVEEMRGRAEAELIEGKETVGGDGAIEVLIKEMHRAEEGMPKTQDPAPKSEKSELDPRQVELDSSIERIVPREEGASGRPRTPEREIAKIDAKIEKLEGESGHGSQQVEHLERQRRMLMNQGIAADPRIDPQIREAAQRRIDTKLGPASPDSARGTKSAELIGEYRESKQSKIDQRDDELGAIAARWQKLPTRQKARILPEFARVMKTFEDGDSITIGAESFRVVRQAGELVLRDIHGNESVWNHRELLDAASRRGISTASLAASAAIPKESTKTDTGENLVPRPAGAFFPSTPQAAAKIRKATKLVEAVHPVFREIKGGGKKLDAAIESGAAEGGERGGWAKHAKAVRTEHPKMGAQKVGVNALHRHLREQAGEEAPRELLTDHVARARLEIPSIEAAVRAEGADTFLNAWREGNIDLFEGAGSAILPSIPEGRSLMSSIRVMAGRDVAESGYTLNPISWGGPIGGAVRGFWWGLTSGNVEKMILREANRAPPKGYASAADAVLRVLPFGFHQMIGPTTYGGFVARDIIAVHQATVGTVARLQRQFFDRTHGVFSGMKEGDAKDVRLHRMLNQGPESDTWTTATKELQFVATELRNYLREVRDVLLRTMPAAQRIEKDIKSYETAVARITSELEVNQSRRAEIKDREGEHENADVLGSLRSRHAKLRKIKDRSEAESKELSSLKRRIDELQTEVNDSMIEEHGISGREARGVASGSKAQLTMLENSLKQRRDQLRDLVKTWGIQEYVPHVMAMQTSMDSGSAYTQMETSKFRMFGGRTSSQNPEQPNARVSSLDAMFRAHSSHMAHRTGKAEEGGKVVESAIRSFHHYIHSMPQYVHRNEVLARHDEYLHGRKDLLTSQEVRNGLDLVMYGNNYYRSYGSGKLVRNEAGEIESIKLDRKLTPEEKVTLFDKLEGIEEFREPTDAERKDALHEAKAPRRKARALEGVKDRGESVVLLYNGADARTKLDSKEWWAREMGYGNIQVVPKRLARTVMATWRDGWYGEVLGLGTKSGRFTADRMREFLNETFIGRMEEIGTGIGQQASKLGRAFAKLTNFAAVYMSSLSLGGPFNIDNGLNAGMGGLLISSASSGRVPGSSAMKAFNRLTRAQKLGDKNVAGLLRAKRGNPAKGEWSKLDDGILDQTKATAEELAKMSPKRRKEREFQDEALESLMRFGLPGGNRGESMGRLYRRAANLQPGETPVKDGHIRRQYHQDGKLPQELDYIGEKASDAFWLPFNMMERLARGLPYLDVFIRARRAGKSPEIARDEALSFTHGTQMIFAAVTKSSFMNSSIGRLMTNMGTWSANWTGRNLAMNDAASVGSKVKYLHNVYAMLVIGNLLGRDFTNVLGARASDAPGVGDILTDMAFNIGDTFEDSDKPHELDPGSPKGLLHNMGMTSLMLPFDPTIGGSIMKSGGDLVKAWRASEEGDEVSADRYLTRGLNAWHPEKLIPGKDWFRAAKRYEHDPATGRARWVNDGPDDLKRLVAYVDSQLLGRSRMREWDHMVLANRRFAYEKSQQRLRSRAGEEYGQSIFGVQEHDRRVREGEVDESPGERSLLVAEGKSAEKRLWKFSKERNPGIDKSGWRSIREERARVGILGAKLPSALRVLSRASDHPSAANQLATLLRDPVLDFSQESVRGAIELRWKSVKALVEWSEDAIDKGGRHRVAANNLADALKVYGDRISALQSDGR